MTATTTVADIVRQLDDPAFASDLTARIAARDLDPGVLERLVNYARARQVSSGQARVRTVLTAAGVSWEAR